MIRAGAIRKQTLEDVLRIIAIVTENGLKDLFLREIISHEATNVDAVLLDTFISFDSGGQQHVVKNKIGSTDNEGNVGIDRLFLHERYQDLFKSIAGCKKSKGNGNLIVPPFLVLKQTRASSPSRNHCWFRRPLYG
jgi:hypothetical protein